MELYQASDHYILVNGEYSIWCNRFNGSLKAGKGTDLCLAWNPICLGIVYGIVGKVRPHPDSEWWLILIRQKSLVGKVCARHDVYKINKIAVLPLSTSDPTELDIELCQKHHFGIKKPERINQAAQGQKRVLQKTLSSIKSAAENVKPRKKEVKDKEKFVKKMLEELQKMFTESDSFYYCDTFDLTNSIQRQHTEGYDKAKPVWIRADERFFWNRHMLKELIDSEDELADHWIQPVIQGYVQQEWCRMDFTENHSPSELLLPLDRGKQEEDCLQYLITLFSRRSRHRAGTRSKKRGLDETGACANYVETEQIIEYQPHVVSFVQVRGSAPMYWSQSGFKYRPPPVLDKDDKETYEAFCQHMDEQLSTYKQLVIVGLSELTGKERIIGEAFLKHVLDYNSSSVTFIAFDFHDYCRGMKFENVSILTEVIKDVIKAMRYCWVDDQGMICEQKGVFRINCVDCLDRTNVVQSAIARIVMETQCRKLGLLPPDEELPLSCRLTYQQLWANNGDAISQQYAGTAALKGDYTRTGERKFSGLMKDGVNSANRYYLRFKDTYRQAAIDLMLGQPIAEEALFLGTNKLSPDSLDGDDAADLLEKEENVKLLIEDCKNMLIVEPEECLGGWGLVDADPVFGDPDRLELDVILLLSQRALYIAWYEDEKEEFIKYQRIFLEDIEKFEIGPEPSLFKSKHVCLRVHYHYYAEEGYFHSFRAPNTRFFNNTVITINNLEEARESLRSICQSFTGALKIFSLELDVVERHKLDRKKTRPHPEAEVTDIHKKLQETSLVAIKMTRDNSSTDLKELHQRETRRKTSPDRTVPDISESLSESQTNKSASRIQQALTLMNKNCSRVIPVLKMPMKMSMPHVNLKNFNPLQIKMPVMLRPKMTLKSFNPIQIMKIGRGDNRTESNNAAISADDENRVQRPDLEKAMSEVKLEREYSRDDISLVVATREVDLVDAVAAGEFELDPETDDEVMLHSCGILATTHGHLLASSLSLSSLDEEPIVMDVLQDSNDQRPLDRASVDLDQKSPAGQFVLEESPDAFPNSTFYSDTCTKPDIPPLELRVQSSKANDMLSEASDNKTNKTHFELGAGLLNNRAAFDIVEYDIINKEDITRSVSAEISSNYVHPISSESQKGEKLKHPNMKISLSEGALDHQHSPAERYDSSDGPKERGGPLSRLRSLRIPNINLPSMPISGSTGLKSARNTRGVELLNQLVESKIEEGKCCLVRL